LSFSAILSEEGYAADGSDGGEGLKMVYDRDYDIIISDVDTPIMNGIEFAAVSLRKHRCIKQKMLFITGDQNRETNRFIKNTGVRCLLKPFKAIELLKAEREIDASASIVRDKFIDI
jgi:CheY-like chemotaxis protein